MSEEIKLAKWLAGEMTEEELREFESTPEYADYARIIKASEKLSAPAFNEDAQYSELVARRSRRVIPLYRKAWLRVAAAIVVLVGLAGYFYATMPVTKEAGAGQQIAFYLPDNSEVILNSGSKASFKKWNWSDNRVVELEGEAYFKVAKGKKFEVTTDLGTVAVLGTQFNVKARDGRFDVNCFEGRVLVKSSNAETIIKGGQAVTFADGKPLEVAAPSGEMPSWMGNQLQFEKETLARIVSELERQYDIKIEVAGGPHGELFTGALPRTDLSRALSIVCATYHLKVEKAENKIVLTPVDDR